MIAFAIVLPSRSTPSYFGTSKAGLRLKNPPGISLKPTRVTGITAHSSGR